MTPPTDQEALQAVTQLGLVICAEGIDLDQLDGQDPTGAKAAQAISLAMRRHTPSFDRLWWLELEARHTASGCPPPRARVLAWVQVHRGPLHLEPLPEHTPRKTPQEQTPQAGQGEQLAWLDWLEKKVGHMG